MRKGVVLLLILAAVSGCTANGPLAPAHTSSAKRSPTPAATPTSTPDQTPSPTPSPTPSSQPAPVEVPAWAAMRASCVNNAAAQEAVLQLQGAPNPVLADVSDARAPRTLCGITGGNFQPQLVTQTMISWFATQGSPSSAGTSLIAVLDLASGTSTVVASWSGGGFMDGLHAWSPDRGFLAYVASDANGVNLHLLSGGGDRVVAQLGAVPGRGASPSEDDAYLAFSPDGAYFALVQTFTSSGDQVQVRRTVDGSLKFNLARGTMAAWGSTGSKLYYRLPSSGMVQAWDSTSGVSQVMSSTGWIRPRAAAGDDEIAYTVRDSTGRPSVFLYGRVSTSAGHAPAPARSSPVWLNATTFFAVEESACSPNCGIGPAWQPDGKTYTFDVATTTETASRITAVYGVWPRPGQT